MMRMNIANTEIATMTTSGTIKIMIKHRVFHSMGIPIHISMAGFSEQEAHEAATKAETIFKEYDLRFSRFKPESELMALNTSNGAWHKVSVELYRVLKRCVALAQETQGVFDPSIGSILASYGYGLPENFTTRAVYPTYRDLAFNDHELLVRLEDGQILEPACIVKGLTVDIAGREILKGIDPKTQGFMINAGGDILTLGTLNSQQGWNIAIEFPHNPQAIATAITLQNAGVATSGTYKTFGEKDGKKWQHLVNMKNPDSQPEIISATVVAPTCEEADTEASLAILLSQGDVIRRLSQKGLPYFLITRDNLVIKNEAFKSLEVPIESLIKTE